MPGSRERQDLQGHCVFPELLLEAKSRALGLLDNNPRSRTHGCFDRAYWQYRTITGFPAATFQQLALPLAILVVTPFEGNTDHECPAMLSRVSAAMRFWTKTQHKNGAVDEWYRNEHSYCATAFTTFAMSECLILLGKRLERETYDLVLKQVERAGVWLAERFNPEVMNQNLAASAALWNVYQLTEKDQWKASFQRTWERTLEGQDEEGWFTEYGGADLGYATLALDLLACLHRRECNSALDAAKPLCGFLASFIVPGGGLGAQLGSRGTAHAFPFGAAYFSAHIPAATELARHINNGLESGRLLTPSDVDDRYLAYFYLPQFALASTLTQEEADQPTQDFAQGDFSWKRSGFVIWRDQDSEKQGSVIISLRRQGAFNLSHPDHAPQVNMGFWVETESGARWSSSFWSEHVPEHELMDRSLTVTGRFTILRDALPLSGGSLAFTFASEWLFRIPAFAERMQRRIRMKNIMQQRPAPLEIKRTLNWNEDGLHVRDIIRVLPGCPRLRTIGPIGDIDVHSPSARLSPRMMHVSLMTDDVDCRQWAKRLNEGGVIELHSVYNGTDLNENRPVTITPVGFGDEV